MAYGRPRTFKTPDDLMEAFSKWRSAFAPGGDRADEIPDVEGFCDYIDSYRDLLNEYDKKKEFSGTVKQIKNWIYYRKKQLAMQGKMNAAIFIFDAKNNAGYVEKMETDITSGGEKIGVNASEEQLAQLVAARTRRTDI